jgi:hypothetical protein
MGSAAWIGLALALASAADGRAENPPDFSGVWTLHLEPGQTPFGFPGAAAKLPFTPAARRKVDEYNALIAAGGDSPGGWCLGSGMPASMLTSGPYPMEIIQRPEQITVIYEAHSEIRRIFMGAPLAEQELFPDRNGYSVGRWDGYTLVVETTHLKEQVDQTYAHSADARIVERYRLTTTDDGKKVLVADLAMTDPVFYTEPVAINKKWALVPNGRLLPYECNEPNWNDHLENLRSKGSSSGAPR